MNCEKDPSWKDRVEVKTDFLTRDRDISETKGMSPTNLQPIKPQMTGSDKQVLDIIVE